MIDRRLLYIVSTARFGSFSAAAKRVGVTQSAVTKSVAEVEQELGYSIFHRTARGVFPTEAGRAFVDRASRILDDTRDLFHGKPVGLDPYADTLRVGVCPGSLESLLVSPVAALHARHPKIRLDVAGGSFDKMVQQLRAGAIDVALGYDAAFETQPDFRRDALAPLRTIFFVRHGHPILDCAEATTADIAKYDLISPSGSPPYDAAWRQIYEQGDLDTHAQVHFIDHFPIVARLVQNSDAISLTSVEYAETRAFKDRFARVPFRTLAPAPLCCATRMRWGPRPAVRAFIQACRERMPP
ncbi:MAG: LysR family transcriptional regulator [Hydrogenophilaceae bacterium]|nr:LysR family transcriptional regulator [Hydrogenophilaceae bacterium]